MVVGRVVVGGGGVRWGGSMGGGGGKVAREHGGLTGEGSNSKNRPSFHEFIVS